MGAIFFEKFTLAGWLQTVCAGNLLTLEDYSKCGADKLTVNIKNILALGIKDEVDT